MNKKYDRKYGLRQLALFSELDVDAGVSIDEVILWIERIPRLDPRHPRAAYYYKWWSVADKIRRHKVEGKYMEAINCADYEPLPKPRANLSSEEKQRLLGLLPSNGYDLNQHYARLLKTKTKKII